MDFRWQYVGAGVLHRDVLPGAGFILKKKWSSSELPIGEWKSTRSRD